jgi:transcriptional regulator with XRE-family HTH domain
MASVRGFRARPKDIGIDRSKEVALRFATELKLARVASGLTQRQLAALAGVSQSAVVQAEAGKIGLSLELRCRLVAAAGHELSLKLYPVRSVRLRDSGQLGIAQVIAAVADVTWRCRLEVLTGPGPFRAADLVLDRPDEVVMIEIERGLVDFQAQLRAAEVKRASLATRESRPVRLVIAVPETRSMRERLNQNAELIGRVLSISSAAIWRALRQGSPIGGDGLLRVHAPPVPQPRAEREA